MRRSRAWASAFGDVLAWWVVLVALYLVFVSTVTLLEFAVGAAGAVLAACGAHALHRASRTSPASGSGRARLAQALLSWPGSLLADTGRLTAASVRSLPLSRRRPVSGGFEMLELHRGTRAAWACAVLSATPGAYVADVATQGDVIMVHVLPGPPSAVERAVTRGGRRR
jgi:multisubunit Na+/H+ antiporter MnhE subunit